MITVKKNGRYGIKASGHAGYAPKGQDIVCAAFTILIETAAESVERMNDSGMLESVCVNLDDGEAVVSCVPYPEYENMAENIFWVITNGIELLCNMYPEYIQKNFRQGWKSQILL